MRNTLRQNNKGFTIVELMISTALLSLASIAIAGLLVQSLRGWSTGTAQINTGGATTVALQKLSNDIRDGASAAVSTDNNTLAVTFLGTITDATTHETIYDPSGRTAVTRRLYYVSNGNLIRYINGSTTIIGKGVTSATFHASYGLVTIVLKSTERVSSKTEPISLEINARVNLRNYRP